MTINIFTIEDCEYCLRLKTYLNNEGIYYKEFNIIEYKYLWDQIINQVEYAGVPMIYISENNNIYGQFFMKGYNYEDDDEIIKILKQY